EARAHVRIEVLAELGELPLIPAETGAENHASAVQTLQRRELLCENLGPPPRYRRDGSSEREVLCCLRDCGERDPRIRRRLSPDEGEVIPDEIAVPSRRLGGARSANGNVWIRPATEVRRADRELQLPTKRGSRFSTNAARPSFASSDAKSSPNESASASRFAR